jgi:hypothetical protein
MQTAEFVMSTRAIADRLYGLFNENKWEQAQDELFWEDAKSIESPGLQWLKSVEGLAAIKKKGIDFNNEVEEVHGGYVGRPIVAGNFIAVAMGVDLTMKGAGRIKMDEIAVYEVKDGKIAKEEFFYSY